MTKLAPNFTLNEFLVGLPSGVSVPADVKHNLTLLAQRLQVVRDYYNRPISITSGYRTPAHNKAIGGAPNSYHLKGMAADVVVQGIPASRLQADFKHWMGGMGLAATFTHLDIRETSTRWTY